MALFDNGQPPPLYVPDLTAPAGAAVAADGTVACVACGSRLPIARMDVVGQGYRCAPCSHRAEIAALSTGAVDAGANLSDTDRDQLRTAGTQTLLGGVGIAILGGCLVAFVPRLGIALLFLGISTGAVGLQRKRAAG